MLYWLKGNGELQTFPHLDITSMKKNKIYIASENGGHYNVELGLGDLLDVKYSPRL